MNGFTLIEILVVTAIIGLIIGFGMIVDWSVIGQNNFSAEQTKIVSILEKARSRAMANMFESPHGVCYVAPNYILFRDTCGGGFTEPIPANANITVTFPTITFEQLTGNATGDTINITDGTKSADIIINDAGTINW